MLALVEAARESLSAGHHQECDETLTRARTRFGEAADLHDVWGELREQQDDIAGGLKHRQRAWDLQPTKGRGLAVARRLPQEDLLPFLRDVLTLFDDDEVIIALTRAELATGGFEAGDNASSFLVERIGGDSEALSDGLAKAIEGQDPEDSAMMAFVPLVSAAIESRVRLERRTAGEEVEDDETATEMLIAATLSIPQSSTEDPDSEHDLPPAGSTEEGTAEVGINAATAWTSPWLDGLIALPGILLAIPFAFFLNDVAFAQYAAMGLTVVFSLVGVGASSWGRSTGHLPSEGDFDPKVTMVMAPLMSFLIGVALLGVSSLVLDWADPSLLERIGLILAAGLAWGGSSILGLRLTS